MLFKKMAEQNLSMEALSKAAGMERGAVKNIKYQRSRNPRIDTVEKLSHALKCYPCELLPVEWQIPENTINQTALEEVVLKLMPIYDKFKDDNNPFTHQEYASVIALFYNRHLKKGIPIEKSEVIRFLQNK